MNQIITAVWLVNCFLLKERTVKILKFRTMCYNHPKSLTKWLFLSVLHPKDAEGIANSVDSDQTAPLGEV